MNYDVAIIGAGIVGLATALKIKEKKPDISLCVLEKENSVAMHQTGNNSGVMHSGIYYKPGSRKALNCIKGYNYLIDFCNKYNISYQITGKLIVAVSENEIPALKEILSRGSANGIKGIRELRKEQLIEYEPYVNGISGLFVPSTGIVNYKSVADKIAQILSNEFNANLLLNQKVTKISFGSNFAEIDTNQGVICAKTLVNTAGLFSDRLARYSVSKEDLRIIPFRGEYYSLKPGKEYLVNNLIYPVPDPNFPFLGVHFTRKLKGGIEAGPNAVFAFKREGYLWSDFSFRDTLGSFGWPGFRKLALKYYSTGIEEFYRSFSKAAFTKALQRLIPEIQEEDLCPGGAGVRAQACDRQGNLIDDFCFTETQRAVNVLNAPSPAATACFSIGDVIADRVLLRFN